MSDASGNTAWTYDNRGRMTQETKVITGSGTFATQWNNYNSADLPLWMKYPADNAGNVGEQVNYAYVRQKAVNSVIGTSTYVQSTDYDPAGRVDLRTLGANVLKNDYVYYDWDTQGGRLQYLKAGTPASPTSLLYLEYDYDNVGNLDWIKDYNAGGTQTQTFHYDGLDRLIDAVASGGTEGPYTQEAYTYDGTTGNLSSKAGVTYAYNDTNHKHAATHLNGVQKYWYDANSNMTSRISGSNTYNFTYDYENHLTGVTGAVTATFVYDGDGNRVKGTIGGVTTAYVGNHFEWTGSTSTMKKYYYFIK